MPHAIVNCTDRQIFIDLLFVKTHNIPTDTDLACFLTIVRVCAQGVPSIALGSLI